MAKKIIIFLLIPVLFGAAFYALNFDFGGLFDALCRNNQEESSQQFGIPTYWLEKHSISVSSAEDLKKDADNDGLGLEDEYKYSTDPNNSDTDKDGYNDGTEIAAGYDPTSLGRLDFDKDNLPDWWEKEVGLDTSKKDYDHDPDNDGLPNHLELAHGTDPLKSDTDGDSYSDFSEISNGYDPSKAGDARPDFSIRIAKILVEAPIVWSRSEAEEDLLKDLEKGLVRYPKTGIPGQFGNAFITGHSSNYVWAKGSYNYILKDLNELQIGDEVIVTATQYNGKKMDYRYVISFKEIVSADDPRMFAETPKPSITLATCWPLGTNWKRLMLKADIVE